MGEVFHVKLGYLKLIEYESPLRIQDFPLIYLGNCAGYHDNYLGGI